MSNINIQCPQCKTRYMVTPMQLSFAHGQVCCVACALQFNAYVYLQVITDEKQSSGLNQTPEKIQPIFRSDYPKADHPALEIFNRKVEASHIDFKTYLNNAQYFNLDTGSSLSGQFIQNSQHLKKQRIKAKWFTSLPIVAINMLLVLIILGHILIYNQDLRETSPTLQAVYRTLCQLFDCNTGHF